MKAYYEKRSYPPELPLRLYKHERNSFSFHAHWHSDVELVLVREGTLRIGINREIQILQKGEAAICCSGDIHFYDSVDKTSAIDILIFQPSLIGCHGNWPQQIRFDHSFITGSMLRDNRLPLSMLERLDEIFQTVYREITDREPCYAMFATGKMLELCGLLQRVLPSSPVDHRLENKRITGLKTMQDIIQYLEDHYMQPLTLAETAGHFGMSVFHFCRLFQSLVGTNFKDYLNAIRADAAEERILSGEESITTVAMECGFNNIRTFNRVFKSAKGYTPSSLRI
ncbi:MAG: hypothetical protein K0Q90_735 [Paenibacillaceae bacterium]|jgi:AraC-like DNA-binding protein|nr:hypothetical protein [Paenibacillaceae bacterium]